MHSVFFLKCILLTEQNFNWISIRDTKVPHPVNQLFGIAKLMTLNLYLRNLALICRHGSKPMNQIYQKSYHVFITSIYEDW